MKRTFSQADLKARNMGFSAEGEGPIEHGDNLAPKSPATVFVVGAGPSGLMLASNLTRYGLEAIIIDDRKEKTLSGKADGMQPKTIETFKQLRLADELLKKSAKVYDISYWESSQDSPLHRTGRQIHYPDHVGASDPYILLAHQGILEDVLIRDLEERGVTVRRNSSFIECAKSHVDGRIDIRYEDLLAKSVRSLRADYLVGCDGARSKVRSFIPNASLVGDVTNASWGVLDGVIETDFPDLWSKVAVRSHAVGSILWIPRERNMTRLYVELTSSEDDRIDKTLATPEYVMNRARKAMHPYKLEWKTVEWFGNYVVGQRIASHFADPDLQIFIAGDAGHCHSALAAQGANTSMHDSFNLAWKLNLVARSLASKALLETYEGERMKIAQDLIRFDAEHVKAFGAGDEALARNFEENIRFISGIGAEYSENTLNEKQTLNDKVSSSMLKPGALLTPGRVSRFIDANPVDIQIDIPLLSQFRIYIIVPNVNTASSFLYSLCTYISSSACLLSRISRAASASYMMHPPPPSPFDDFAQYERYRAVSNIFTYALITRTSKTEMEISQLPSLLKESRWTIYLDNVMDQDGCTGKWLGEVKDDEAVIVNVRPDGYVGSIGRWQGLNAQVHGTELAKKAGAWLEKYYGGFLREE